MCLIFLNMPVMLILCFLCTCHLSLGTLQLSGIVGSCKFMSAVAHTVLVAHLLPNRQSCAVSAQSLSRLIHSDITCSDWSGLRWTNCPLRSHTQLIEAPLTHGETRTADGLRQWKLLTTQVVTPLQDPSDGANERWTCQLSDLCSEELERRLRRVDSQLFEAVMAISRSTHSKRLHKETHTKKW